jgi:hypothetical protein|tara:strand:- start:6892 stop:7518 length:627 start_codon:yes stop_codon:yes gene_type:complete
MDLRLLLESLLAGQFICEITDKEAFNYLSTQKGVDSVNNALLPFDREVIQLTDGYAFYLVSKDIDNTSDKVNIRKHFESCRDHIEPVVSFIVLLTRIQPESGILTVGRTIRYSELLSRVLGNEHNIQQLNQLMTLKLFRTNKTGSDDKLKSLLKGMIDIGVLVEKNAAEMLYQVTGKLDYYHQVMQFIVDHESIDLIEQPSDQSEFTV